MNKTIPIVIIIVGVLIAGVIVYTNYVKYPECAKCPEGVLTEDSILSVQEAGDKIVGFINDNILQGQADISLIETLEESGLYKVKFEVGEEEAEWWITGDGNFIFPQAINLAEFKSLAEETGQTIGNFSVSSDEICMEDDKPIIYFFGSDGCPHCSWEHPIIEETAGEFDGYVSFHNNMNSDADMDVFQKYSTGGVPTLVLGCKYYRVGSGEGTGEEKETENLTALICELTNNQPAEVCQK